MSVIYFTSEAMRNNSSFKHFTLNDSTHCMKV